MRQNTKKKRSGFGYFIRMFLLLVELLAVTLFLWGNDAYSISATTPEFKWENYKTYCSNDSILQLNKKIRCNCHNVNKRFKWRVLQIFVFDFNLNYAKYA